jgi:hypothetical protein
MIYRVSFTYTDHFFLLELEAGEAGDKISFILGKTLEVIW